MLLSNRRFRTERNFESQTAILRLFLPIAHPLRCLQARTPRITTGPGLLVVAVMTPLSSTLPSWSPLDIKFGWSFSMAKSLQLRHSKTHNSCVVLSIVASLAVALTRKLLRLPLPAMPSSNVLHELSGKEHCCSRARTMVKAIDDWRLSWFRHS
jgi:hypothetical protein